MQDIQHWWGNQADKEVIDLLLERLLSGDTQLDAVLIATPLARRRVGNISDGRVHAMGPHDTPYESVKKSELVKLRCRKYKLILRKYSPPLYVLANLVQRMLLQSLLQNVRMSFQSILD